MKSIFYQRHFELPNLLVSQKKELTNPILSGPARGMNSELSLIVANKVERSVLENFFSMMVIMLPSIQRVSILIFDKPLKQFIFFSFIEKKEV